MAEVSFRQVCKVYSSGVKAVSDFSLDIKDKEFMVFVGPSGSGKSTVLRMIAGLEDVTAGEILIDGDIVNNKPPKNRGIAMVFQNYALYPHMTVFDNIALGLKIAKTDKNTIKKMVEQTAATLGIMDVLQRKPRALSGGQRQRVALGRALVMNPKVFLLDEPLSNLDAKLRAEMRAEIIRLHKTMQTTFVYVTHDQVEAMTMGSRIAVINGGYIRQVDTPSNLYNYPADKFVAGFIGTPQMNFFNALITKQKDKCFLNLAGHKSDMNFWTKKLSDSVNNKDDKDSLHTADCINIDQIKTDSMPVIVGIRPEDVRLVRTKKTSKDCIILQVAVSLTEELGSETIIYADFSGGEMQKDLIALKSETAHGLKQGDIVEIALLKNRFRFFDAQTEKSVCFFKEN